MFANGCFNELVGFVVCLFQCKLGTDMTGHTRHDQHDTHATDGQTHTGTPTHKKMQ